MSRVLRRGLRGLGRRLSDLGQDGRGTAAVEAGIVIAALLAPMLALLAGAGQAMLTQYRVDRATHAALLYAWGAPVAALADTATIKSAAQSGYGTANGATALTATASLACYCLDQTGTRVSANTSSVSCTGTCAVAGQVMGKWVTVTSSASFTPILSSVWGSSAWTLQNSSTVRIQ